MTTAVRYLPVRVSRLSLDMFAAHSGVHPDLVRQFVRLGLLDPEWDAAGRPWFSARDLLTMARIQRLHDGLALNYAAIGLVLDLLNQIDQLHAAARRSATQWT